MSEATQFKVKVVAAFAVIYIVWGTTFLAIRIAVETIPPFMTAGLRFSWPGRDAADPAGAGRALPQPGPLALGGDRGRADAGGRHRPAHLLRDAHPSGLAALMVTTIPVWITLLGWLVAGGKRPGAQTFVGLGLGFAGAAGLFAPALVSETGDYDLVGMGSADRRVHLRRRERLFAACPDAKGYRDRHGERDAGAGCCCC
ncbi:MAG: hypothetical protein U0232_02700 [Thermomicrobiales bacterium]